jgi:Virulence protein RhuM family
MEKPPIIIYNTADGKANVTLFAHDGSVWMNQNQLAELFDTSKQNIGQHIANILEEKELVEHSVVKNFFTTAADSKQYEVAFYALEMILAIGFRVRSKRGTHFRTKKSCKTLVPLPMRRWNKKSMNYTHSLTNVVRSQMLKPKMRRIWKTYVHWNNKSKTKKHKSIA